MSTEACAPCVCTNMERDRQGRCGPGHNRLLGEPAVGSTGHPWEKGLWGESEVPPPGCGRCSLVGACSSPLAALLRDATPIPDQACAFKGCQAETSCVRTGTSMTGETCPCPAFLHAHTHTHTPRNQDTRTLGPREHQVTLWICEAGQAENLAGAPGCLAGKLCKIHTGTNGNNGIRKTKKIYAKWG